MISSVLNARVLEGVRQGLYEEGEDPVARRFDDPYVPVRRDQTASHQVDNFNSR